MPSAADSDHGRRLYALSRRQRHALSGGTALRTPRNAVVCRLGRRRVYPLLLSWLEIRRLGTMCRAASRRTDVCGKGPHSRLSSERIHWAGLRLSRSRPPAAFAALSAIGESGYLAGRGCTAADLQLF